MTVRTLVCFTLVCFAPAVLGAQPPADMAASRAEAAADWDEAVRLHRAALAADPRRSDLWVRIADIEARRGNLPACVDALEKAVKVTPDSASLYVRLSQAYASVGVGQAALHAIDAALALKPRDPAYLRARATLATWVADYRAAQDSYRQLEALYPRDPDITLALARVSAWSGDADEAVKQYKRYLGAEGSSPMVWLELARAESWRGNYAAAVTAIETYGARVGVTESYLAEMAAVFANAGRPRKAEGLVTGLLARTPDSYELNLTHTIALARQRRAKEAFATLDTVRRLSPDRQETHTAESVLRTLLASSAESPFRVYGDSDRLRVQRFSPHADVSLRTGTLLSAGYERTRLDARSGSGLDRVDGSPVAHHEHMWAGAAQRLGWITVNGQIGYANSARHVNTTYEVGADARPADSIRLALSRASAPFVVSPRSVDLGLTSTAHRAQIEWMPTLQHFVVFDAAFQELSDGNNRWEVTLSPRRSVARRAGFNLDLGATAYRLETTRDLDHGYYDPRRYEFYAGTMYPYFKVRENVGLAMAIAIGAQRDDRWPSFRLGGSVSAEATFGIYQPWLLKVNGSATLNRRLDSGAFRGFAAGAALVRRF